MPPPDRPSVNGHGDGGAAAVSAGGIVLRPTLTGHEVVLVHRSRYADWSFPKGKPEPGESFVAAALREVHEETGLRCEATEYLGSLRYDDEAVSPKRAHYWLMRVVAEEPFTPTAEIDDRRWFELGTAAEVLTRPIDRDLLARV